MGTLKYDWIYDLPHDYELKKYIFLSTYQQFENNIDNNELFSTLIEIELHLNSLFKFKYENQDLTHKTIIGLDLDLMDLSYDKEEVDNNALFEIAEYAILKLEKLHKKLRGKWMDISDNIHLTEIPKNRPINIAGFVFIILNEHIEVYSYNKITHITEDWRMFILKKESTIENNVQTMGEFIMAMEKNKDLHRYWRCDLKDIDFDNINYIDTILPIVKYNLFNMLKVI